MKSLCPTLLLSLLLSASFACSESGTNAPDCESGKCDEFDQPDSEVEASPCDGTIVDKSGRGLQGKIAGRLNDPFAQLFLRAGDDCPTGFEEIVKKLEKTEARNGFSCSKQRRSQLVSETAQVLGEATSYRVVTALDCEQPDGGLPNRTGVLFSAFGLTPDGDLPETVEVIAFDQSRGIFNYYESEGDKINFFGNSRDMLSGPGSSGDRRCAACHTGGGLIMKELKAPWLHWEGDTNTPGAEELISKHEAVLGSRSDGIDLEAIVTLGNRVWSAARAAHSIDSGDTQELLRPLFCTTEVNLNSATFTPGSSKKGVASSFRLTPAIFGDNLGFGSIEGTEEEYDAVIRANGQRLEGLPAEHIETIFGLTTVTKAEADLDYLQVLIRVGIIDLKLISAIAAVDFTRLAFSDDRCDLLANVPNLPREDLNPEKITNAILAELGDPAEGTPEAELKKNLLADANMVLENGDVFTAACEARTEKESVSFTKDGASQTMEVPSMLVDYMKIISLNRTLARELPIMEFPQTMPTDDQNIPRGTRLDPNTCMLTDKFVPAGVATCCRTCGPNSQACGDSCISKDLVCSQPTGCACDS